MTEAPDQTPEPPRARPLFTPERATIAALVLSSAALVLAAVPWLTGGGDFDQKVRTYLLQNPEILQEMSTALQANQDNALADAINERAAANPGLLAVDADDPAFGPADAKVTVIEFFDFRCPGCKATAPEVLRLMQAHPDVRFVFKDWPILDRGTEVTSHYAARAAQAAHRQGKYLPVFRDLMAEPALDPAAVDRILAANGVALPQAEAAMESVGVARHLTEIQAAAQTLGLVGTPTFFVNGRASASIQPADIDRAIREAKARG
ncbi:MAG: thioredoxin domain-containing protein [Brevundimonas sp.]|uniref:DsbA family protein n=1 Tax=Brevundimonas sp. TaxID=1871086 RepID=UPI0017C77468|nr:thioredoxin domain-containing protein [Brevundimonas sp.]MBA4804449.1 thioredoxin domain-containing protein [Brevundimonas sp.]